jgi:phosphohistidine phosphatase SixA
MSIYQSVYRPSRGEIHPARRRPRPYGTGQGKGGGAGRSASRKDIRQIYSTETRRTRQTAEPLSLQIGVPVRTYANDTLLKFLYRVLDEEKNTVIVGHSNSVLKMLDEWSLKHSIKEIPDNDYDNLFVVSAKPKNGSGGI